MKIFIGKNGNANLYLTKIKTKVKPGLIVPPEHRGNVGIFIEDILRSEGHALNPGPGPDLYKIEVKTAMLKSTSGISIGSLNVNRIISTPWEKTHLFNKCQAWFLVQYCNERHVVTSAELFDLTDSYIQTYFKTAYEDARTQVIAEQNLPPDNKTKYISKSTWAYLENVTCKPETKQYDFRLYRNQLPKLCSIATTVNDQSMMTFPVVDISAKVKTKNVSAPKKPRTKRVVLQNASTDLWIPSI